MEAKDADEEQVLKDHRSMFALPVDADQKATELRLFSIAPPHMLAFHLAWLSLFSNFFSTFSIPPLLAVIRDDLNLTDTDTGHAGTAAFLGSIFSRIAMGPICDLLGPRIAIATLSLPMMHGHGRRPTYPVSDTQGYGYAGRYVRIRD
ncbi:hypothetical protein ACFX1X_023746 [Malus domestica]